MTAGSANDASVDPAGASDSASGSTLSSLNFAATSTTFTVARDAIPNASASAGGSGGILTTYDSNANSAITPTMVIPARHLPTKRTYLHVSALPMSK